MQKGNINFKQIRKKVTQNQPHFLRDQNNQDNLINPTHKVSFRGIKKNQENIPPLDTQGKNFGYYYRTPIKPQTTKNCNGVNASRDREDCNKFSILLESKGYSNCNSGRKKSGDISFRNLVGNTSNASNGGQSNQNCSNLNNSSKYRINTERTQPQLLKVEIIQQKYKQIKQKNYFSSRQTPGQLNSLNKLKTKLISPLKKKSESQPQPEPTDYRPSKQLIKKPQVHKQEQRQKQKQQQKEKQKEKQKVIHIFQHSSILSEHDLVNMSKTNDSIDFDMSPCL